MKLNFKNYSTERFFTDVISESMVNRIKEDITTTAKECHENWTPTLITVEWISLDLSIYVEMEGINNVDASEVYVDFDIDFREYL